MIALAQRRHWIFDLDGTLTVAQHDFDAMRMLLGIPRGRPILEYIAEQTAARAAELTHTLDEIEVELAHKSEAASGCVRLLTTLHAQGCRLGVLTRNSRRNALIALDAIGALNCFDHACILGRNEALPKPSPEGIHHLLTRWQGTSTDACMVGDFRYDLEAGRAARCLTVHVSGARNERWPDLTDLHVRSLEELTALI